MRCEVNIAQYRRAVINKCAKFHLLRAYGNFHSAATRADVRMSASGSSTATGITPRDHSRETLLSKLGPFEQHVPGEQTTIECPQREELRRAVAISRHRRTDLRLFRMRSDRDAINNDALTDPMAGGRPHESHDLTFAWVGCPRPIARERASQLERADRDAIFARAAAREREKQREEQESNFKCNGDRHHRCDAMRRRRRRRNLARALRTFAFSLHSPPWPLPPIP